MATKKMVKKPAMKKGGATKYQKGGASDPIKAMYKAKGEKMPTTKETLEYVSKNGSGYIPSNKSSKVDTTKWKEKMKAPNAKKYQNGGITKKYQDGGKITPVPGMKKSQAKAEEFYDKNPGVRTYTNEYTGKKIPTGPMTQQDYREAAARAADVYDESKMPNRKKGGAMKKMKTGGMVNPNAKLQAAKSAGSKGVKSGVNPKAAASKVARGRSGGTSAAPKTALPKAQKGWSVTDPAKEGRMGSGKVATKTSPTLSGGSKTKTISYGAIYPGAKGSITKTKRNAQGTVVKETKKDISQDRASRMINRRSK